MAREFKIPGGKQKDVTLVRADAQSIGWWLKTIETNLAEGKSKYPDSDKEWVAAARAELARRKAGGAQQQAPAGATAAAPAQQQRPPSTALTTRGVDALSGSFADPKTAREHLQKAASEAHLVAPATDCGTIPEGCDVAVSLVWVDPNTKADGPGDVYDVGGKCGLAKATLDRIAGAAAITWDSRKSGRLDDGRDPYYAMFQAVGYIRNFDGSLREIFGTKEMDLREGSAQLEALWDRYAAKKKRFDAGQDRYEPKSPEGQIREMRLHILAHAETKARLRAVRSIGIKAAYSPAELAKPFAVARLMFTGRTNDPELKRIFAEKQADAMLGGLANLYGGGQPPALVGPQADRTPALPARVISAPPLGSVREPLDDGDEEYDTRGAEEPAPAEPPTKQPAQQQAATPPAEQQKLGGLPPDQDRGGSPEDY
jgi:hypothetical protein